MRSRWGVGSCGIVWLLLAAGVFVASGVVARGADDARVLAATIDRLVAARWDASRVAPAPPASDGEFLRRVSLDLTGKIPSVAEVRAFLDDPRPDKRERLIDRLLDGPAYIAHTTNVDSRLMIPEADSNPQAEVAAPAFEAWLREQVAANAGSDAIVRAILTVPIAGDRPQAEPSRTNAPSPGPSPLPFYVAKDVKSENIAASTARLFLGLRLECAQCHNHPFASWTRDQFWSYAAFFSSLERRGPDDVSPNPIRERPDHHEAAIPGTAKVVQATFLDGSAPRFRPHEPARMTLADWMTAPENPYFARAAVNRIWAQLFGVGLVDPVDDMGADNPPSHPELLDALARAFAEHGFDRKFLIRAIVLSRPYQLSSIATDPGAAANVDTSTGAEAPRLFARMRVRGLTAEQLYDSLTLAVGLSPGATGADRPGDTATSPRAEFLERFARHDESSTEMQMSILQALTLMNGRLVAGATHLQRSATLSAIAEAPFLDTAGRVEALFLATVSRRPKTEEAARMIAYVEGGGTSGDPKKALSDVFWALLNSPEFVLNH